MLFFFFAKTGPLLVSSDPCLTVTKVLKNEFIWFIKFIYKSKSKSTSYFAKPINTASRMKIQRTKIHPKCKLGSEYGN